MSFNIEVEGGTSVRLPTAGKYCDRDIVITATGGGDGYDRGYADGYEIGNAEGYTKGHADGMKQGYAEVEAQQVIIDGLANLTLQEYYNDRITNIGTYAFYRQNIVKINCPNVTDIGANAFYYCESLTYIEFPLLRSINANAFFGDSKLKTADLPSITNIGANSFANSGITTLIIRSGSICSLSSVTAFNNTPIGNGTGYIYVPDNLVEQYKAANNWSTYANQIRAIEDYPEITGG